MTPSPAPAMPDVRFPSDTPVDEEKAAGSHTSDIAIPAHLPIRERILHFTWAWFKLTMATGAIATLLHAQPHRFRGLTLIGEIAFIFFLVLLVFNITVITLRFALLKRALYLSLAHPTESLFFPCLWLSLGNLIINTHHYGVPHCGVWLLTVLRVLFWVYVACAFTSGVAQYYVLFTAGKHMTIHSMTFGWTLPIFPAMLAGTIAAAISRTQPPDRRLPIIVAGLALQGLGFMMSSMMMALYMYRLMVQGLPDVHARPGMFMALGPPSFTGIALIGLAENLPRGYGYFARHPLAVDVLQPVALFIAIFLWLFACFFFSMSTVACIAQARSLSFSLIWWAFVIPNAGFAVVTIRIGEQLESEGILWTGTVMSVVVVGFCLVNLVLLGRAVVIKQILWPGRDEDRDVVTSYEKTRERMRLGSWRPSPSRSGREHVLQRHSSPL